MAKKGKKGKLKQLPSPLKATAKLPSIEARIALIEKLDKENQQIMKNEMNTLNAFKRYKQKETDFKNKYKK